MTLAGSARTDYRPVYSEMHVFLGTIIQDTKNRVNTLFSASRLYFQ